MSPTERMQADARKAEILKAAMAVFALKGFAATTTKDLASSAGVSEALLYKHFPSKENLYREMGQYICQDASIVSALISQMVPSTRSLIMGMYYLSRIVLNGPPGGRQLNEFLQRLMTRSLLEDGMFATAFLESAFLPYVDPLQTWFQAARRSGDLATEASSDRLAILFAHHAMVGIRIHTLRQGELESMGADPETLLREAFLYNLRGAGLKEAAIRKHADFHKLDQWFTDIFNQAQPEPDLHQKISTSRSKP